MMVIDTVVLYCIIAFLMGVVVGISIGLKTISDIKKVIKEDF